MTKAFSKGVPRAVGARNNRGAQKTEVDGRIFDSKFESQRYMTLKNLESNGLIADLECQVKYPIQINGIKVCDYIADFVYTKLHGAHAGYRIVEDAKGFRDTTYRLKAKLFWAHHGYPIWESDNAGAIARNPVVNIVNLRALRDAFPLELLPKAVAKRIITSAPGELMDPELALEAAG